MKKIRVGILTSRHYPLLGGMEFYNHFLAESLNKLAGVKAAVACSEMPDIPADFPYSYPVYRSQSFWRLTGWLNQLNRSKMIEREGVNVLHGSMLHDGGLLALAAGRKLGLPVVVQSHGSDVQTVPEIGYGACLNADTRQVVEKVIDGADHIIALSQINRQHIVELGGKEDNISIIHNGTHTREIRGIPFDDQRPRYHLHKDDFVIITVGRNRPIKRLDLLFKALALMGDSAKNIKCLCVGPDEGLEQLAEQYGVKNNVILTGVIPGSHQAMLAPPSAQLINLYRSADLYISTSYAEAFGIAALESLASGTPVLVGSKHGVQDIVQRAKTGWIMRDDSPEELAEIILNAYRSKGQQNMLTQEIIASVSHLSWDNVARQVRDVYAGVLER